MLRLLHAPVWNYACIGIWLQNCITKSVTCCVLNPNTRCWIASYPPTFIGGTIRAILAKLHDAVLQVRCLVWVEYWRTSVHKATIFCALMRPAGTRHRKNVTSVQQWRPSSHRIAAEFDASRATAKREWTHLLRPPTENLSCDFLEGSKNYNDPAL